METTLNQPLEPCGETTPSDDGTTTKWKTVPGYEEFEVTVDGQIRENGGPPRLRVAGTGHIYVLRRHSRPALLVHRAVLLAFRGPPEPGQICRHRDDNPAHNHLDNLVWGTKKENAEDRERNAIHKNPGWTEERKLLERIKALEADNLRLKTQNMRFAATIMNLMADRNLRITKSLLQELGL
jgi:hypothetical protein